MVRVIVDLEALRVRNCGLGQFSLHLGQALLEARGSDLQLSYFLRERDRDAFAAADVDFVFAQEWRREEFCRRLRPILRKMCREPRYDVWHMSNQLARFWPLDPSVPVLLTIHDLNFLREFNQRQIEREFVKLQIKLDRAAVVATDTHFVADEIRAHLNLRGKEIAVVHCGANLHTSEPPARPEFLGDRKFLFTIGEINPKKNFHVLLDLVIRLPEYALVIAGNKSSEYARSIEAQVQEKGLTERVFLPGQISAGERLWLYQNCEALLFPSRTEGFGLPVIEAMSAGRPVFMSHATSLPEVGGPLGFYWHSFDIDHMCEVLHQGMRKFRSTPDYSDQLKRHAAQFTWQQTAEKYAALYRSIAAGSSDRRRAA